MKYTLLVLCILFFSCKKDDKKTSAKTLLMASSKWKLDDGGIDGNSDGVIDFSFSTLPVIPACVLDNEATFNQDGSGTTDEGPLKCDTAQQTTNFSWVFLNNENDIRISGPGVFGGGQFRIRELTSTRFGLSKDTTLMGLPATLLLYLKH
jgi:hypothetical protein